MKRKVIVGTLVITLVGGSLLGASHVLAQDSAEQSPVSSLVQKIADTFHLNKDDVQKVFDQQRQERQTQMEQKYADHLSQLVKEGKITDAQKQLILDKHKELETNHQQGLSDLKSKTPEERKAAMDAERTELETWAKQNGVDLNYLMFGFGQPGMRMMHMGKWHGMNQPTSTPTQ